MAFRYDIISTPPPRRSARTEQRRVEREEEARRRGIAQSGRDTRQAQSKDETRRVAAIAREAEESRAEEQLSLDKISKTTRTCPGCGWPIEKSYGCDYITCEYFQATLNAF